MFVLGASGGITALGDTLAIGGGISPTENVIVGQIVGLRIYHPIIAFIVCGLVALAYWQVRRHRPAALPFARWALGLFVAQLLVGSFNVALKAPVWLQLFHLLVTNAIWILVVLMAATAFAAAKETAGEPARTEAGLGKPLRSSVN
jgi:heme a synthase